MPRVPILGAAAALVLLAAGCQQGGGGKAPPPRPPVPVVVAAAVTGSVPVTFASNGTVEPVQTVDVQPQTSGPVTAVRFAEGDEVRAGQVLFELDARPARAALAQAQAVLARDRASAAAARADAARYGSLVAQGYVTQSQAAQQQASADALDATVAADQAAVQAARVNLDYTTIRSPIAGRTGSLNVRLGNVVRVPNAVPLVTVNAVAPVLVRFPAPDRMLPAVREAQRAGRDLAVTVSGEATGGVVERGTLVFIDNTIDSVSGSVTLKARFANTDRRLWPGSFLPVSVRLGEVSDAVLIPAVAVQQGPAGSYVFMPDGQGKARQVPVTVDRTVDDVAVIARGVAAGDRVVVDGQSRLFPRRPCAWRAPCRSGSPGPPRPRLRPGPRRRAPPPPARPPP
jgi:multidrug efflux system membrane fusion protein